MYRVSRMFMLCLLLATLSSAQTITNIRQTVENGRIVIKYDLNGSGEYDIKLTATDKTGQTITPTVIAGEIQSVSAGRDHFIWWEPQMEGLALQGWTVELKAKAIPKDMVFVKGGTFQMGNNGGSADEKPVHKVMVNDFWMGKYEVTQKEWREIMKTNPSYFKGDNLPVEQVSWFEVVDFCNWKSQKEGLSPCYTINGTNVSCNFRANGYRLPTEAEWEYAARGGNQGLGYKYAGSDNLKEVGWYGSNSGDRTHPVGQKKSNELGSYDMTGNVWEWCWDWYDSEYYQKSPQSDPQGPSSGNSRVLRGGSWGGGPVYVRCAGRNDSRPFNRNGNVGFRFVRTK